MAVNGTGVAAGVVGGALVGAKYGSVLGVPGAVVGGVVGGAIGLFSGGKKEKVEYKPLDIAKVISDARTAASENFQNSIALEKQYRPGTASLRAANDTALANMFSGATPAQQANASLLSTLGVSPIDVGGIGSTTGNPLLEESANRIMANLKLGGALGPDVQAQAVKAALEKGGAAGISGSGAVRGLVARDLGLTSLGLEKDRIAQAQDAGTRQAQLALQGDQLRLAGQQLTLQDFLSRAGLLQKAGDQELQRSGLLASIIDSRALPESGLNPGSIASLYIGNNNAANQVDTTNAAIGQQQRNAQLNALLGLGSLAAGNRDTFASLFKRQDINSGVVDMGGPNG